MPYIKKYVYSGDTLEIEKYYSGRYGKKGYRENNKSKTSEEIKRINERNSEKKLRRLITNNFKNGDIFLTVTYKKTISEELAKIELTK